MQVPMVTNVRKPVEEPLFEYAGQRAHVPVQRHQRGTAAQKMVEVPRVLMEDTVVKLPVQRRAQVQKIANGRKVLEVPRPSTWTTSSTSWARSTRTSQWCTRSRCRWRS